MMAEIIHCVPNKLEYFIAFVMLVISLVYCMSSGWKGVLKMYIGGAAIIAAVMIQANIFWDFNVADILFMCTRLGNIGFGYGIVAGAIVATIFLLIRLAFNKIEL